MNGQLLAGRYQIEHLLGAGGFGQTFIAKDRLDSSNESLDAIAKLTIDTFPSFSWRNCKNTASS